MSTKTPMMLRMEQKFGTPIVPLLLVTLNQERSLAAAARKLGIGTAILNIWVFRLGLERQTKWVQSGNRTRGRHNGRA